MPVLKYKDGNDWKVASKNVAYEMSDIPAPTQQELHFSGNCSNQFKKGWGWFIDKYGKYITTSGLTDISYMFSNCEAKEIPFKLNGTINDNISNLFYLCDNVKTIADDCLNGIKLPTTTSSLRYIQAKSMFENCSSLRKLPQLDFLGGLKDCLPSSYFYSFYQNTFRWCNCLDEITNIPVIYDWATNRNWFNDETFHYCQRASRITFGTVYNNNKWIYQVVDLSNEVGYCSTAGNITTSGIPYAKGVNDDTKYQALKNDPDWFSIGWNYSRYNKVSAIETINSLPDCSALAMSQNATNTIKFRGNAGAKTDGGAINTMTEEEIAVATAKGWTVSFV